MAIMTLVIIQIASLLFAYNDLHNAAREGARRFAVEDNILYGDQTGAVDIDGPALSCVGGTPPDAGTVEDIVCKRLAGWDKRVEVVARANSPAAPSNVATGCSEVIVTVRMNMADAALFDIFGALTSRTLTAEASMITEYQLVTNQEVCDPV